MNTISTVLEAYQLLATWYRPGYKVTLTKHNLRLDAFDKIVAVMDDSGGFCLEPCTYKSLDGVIFRDNQGREEIIPWKQYLEWNKPLHIRKELSLIG